MKFVIQCNMLKESQLLAIKEAVEGLPHQFVGLIPFSREITCDSPIEGLSYIPYGSTSFVETTYDLKWEGLSFDPTLFTYGMACANRDDMLNSDCLRLGAENMVKHLETRTKTDTIFMRPNHDLKQFSGGIYLVREAIELLTDTVLCGSSGTYKIAKDFQVIISSPKNVLIEWRWFIVGGKIIDGSVYRRNGQLVKKHIVESATGREHDLVKQWLPHPNCVMDTCLLDTGGHKIVEFNCINGSGFYDHDIKKVMTAWFQYFSKDAK